LVLFIKCRIGDLRKKHPHELVRHILLGIFCTRHSGFVDWDHRFIESPCAGGFSSADV